MTEPNDQAFPQLDESSDQDHGIFKHFSTGGLTKREWLAGLAMQGMVGQAFNLTGASALAALGEKHNTDAEGALAICAASMADALIVELNRTAK